MNSKSALLQQKIRYQRWVEEVKDCESRPANVSIRSWCAEKGIKTPTYYAHLRKVKELCLDLYAESENDSCASVNHNATVTEPVTQSTFVELQIPSIQGLEPVQQPAITISLGRSTIEISEDISDAFLIRLLGALNNA